MNNKQHVPKPPSEIIKRIWSPEGEDKKLIKQAYKFARNAHAGQKRRSGRPYFHHVVETAIILAELGQDAETIAAGLLHDTIDDTDTEPEDIQNNFGEEILFLVQGVSQLGHVRYHGLDRHVESLRKLFVATARDLRVLIIKLADRLHNMRTLKHIPNNKQERIAQETMQVYVPTAHRLGINTIKTELEDEAFRYTQPDKYRHVRNIAASKYDKGITVIERMRKKLVTLLNEDSHIEDPSLSYRLKGLYSLYEKLERKNMNIDEIYDIVALRVIVQSVSECYQALGIVNHEWQPLPDRLKDYIANPKPNGYQSLHTTVFTGDGSIAEVQIRTEAMHETAEYGAASHANYKAQNDGYLHWFDDLVNKITPEQYTKDDDNQEQSTPAWIQAIIDQQQAANDPAEFMQLLESDFFADRIFVFTPDGDVIDLPKGASPIDFAYHIHTDIGNHTKEVKVNNKLAALDTELENGDIVEIITDENSSPSRKWLQYVKTATARRKITSAIKTDN